jgi:acetyl esterase
MASPATQRMMVRKLLSLPTAMLRLMAGGGVVYQGGRTLEPRLQYLAAQARGAAPITTLSPEEARRTSAADVATLTGDLEPGVHVESLSMAPEHRFPAGLEDMLAAYRWGRDNAERFGAPLAQAAVGGDSIGGNFAAVICQELRRAGEPQPILQLLIYPWVDVACESASMTTYGEAFPLTRATLDWFAGHYMGPGDSPADPLLSPLRAENLSGLAPAVVISAGFDPLLDQGEAYARRLKEAGVPVVYRCYDGLTHAFTAYTGAVPCADVACREVAGLVREGLEGRIA